MLIDGNEAGQEATRRASRRAWLDADRWQLACSGREGSMLDRQQLAMLPPTRRKAWHDADRRQQQHAPWPGLVRY
jgi:hypothetical protein